MNRAVQRFIVAIIGVLLLGLSAPLGEAQDVADAADGGAQVVTERLAHPDSIDLLPDDPAPPPFEAAPAADRGAIMTAIIVPARMSPVAKETLARMASRITRGLSTACPSSVSTPARVSLASTFGPCSSRRWAASSSVSPSGRVPNRWHTPRGIRCCGIDQGLRNVDPLSLVPRSGDEVLGNHGAAHGTAGAVYPKAFAMTNAAEAANPPTITVWAALRTGLPVVNKPLM
jgi:hypothetical protein